MSSYDIDLNLHVKEDGNLDSINAKIKNAKKELEKPVKFKTEVEDIDTKDLNKEKENIAKDPIKFKIEFDDSTLKNSLSDLKSNLESIKGIMKSMTGSGSDKLSISVDGIDQLINKLSTLQVSMEKVTSYMSSKNLRPKDVIQSDIDQWNKALTVAKEYQDVIDDHYQKVSNKNFNHGIQLQQ